eukprot:TRINITY_DN17941_c0_g1_i1.p1 TRINITY_DN17941_c0_g1~~TRINITY_DN17941_c0_g1_i1.p1  ORF type:complete len:434 (+),score=94.59 TRINITY_DN17941_c0_g1_i1:137-1438(+)
MGTCACCPGRAARCSRVRGGPNTDSGSSGSSTDNLNSSSGATPFSHALGSAGAAQSVSWHQAPLLEDDPALRLVERVMLGADEQRRDALATPPVPPVPCTAASARRGRMLDRAHPAFQVAWRAVSRVFVCNACGARLARPEDCLPRGLVSLQPVQPVLHDAWASQDTLVLPVDLTCNVAKPVRPRLSSSLRGGPALPVVPPRAYPAALPPAASDTHSPPPALRRSAQDGVLEYHMSAAECWQCRRYVGMCVHSCSPRAGADAVEVTKRRQKLLEYAPPGFVAQNPTSGREVWPLPLQLSFVGLRYTRLVDAHALRDVIPRTPLSCVACGEVLSWADALLCTKRRWGFGDGPSQGACYICAVSGTVVAKAQREERLAQGRFLMEDLYCCCGKQVGYKFVRDLSRDQRNVHQVGRYGLVISCFRIGSGASAVPPP